MTPTLLILTLFLLTSLVLVAGYFFYRLAFFPKRYTHDETLKMEIDLGKIKNLDEYKTWPREQIQIASPHGYTLHALYFPLNKSRRTMIFSHGITINMIGSIKYMSIFRSRGFNCLIYDNRFHGGSGGQNCTFGYFEKDDLKTLASWIYEHNGPDEVIGTHGESLGAAITLQHAAIDDRIAFAIADCPFSDLRQLFSLRLSQDYHLPSFPLLDLCHWYARILIGFDFNLASPLHNLDKIKTPILFIHGDRDGYIPPSMSVDMQRAKIAGISRIYLAKGAKHAEAYSSNPNEYEKQVTDFLEDIGINISMSERLSSV